MGKGKTKMKTSEREIKRIKANIGHDITLTTVFDEKLNGKILRDQMYESSIVYITLNDDEWMAIGKDCIRDILEIKDEKK
jgi:hypothetical protein